MYVCMCVCVCVCVHNIFLRVLEPARRSPKRRKVSYKQVKSLQASLKRAAAGANPVESHDSISLVQSVSSRGCMKDVVL